jgi:hypothetical protein
MTQTIAAQSRPDAHFRIAQCLGALGRRTEAISTLTEAIRLMGTLQPDFRAGRGSGDAGCPAGGGRPDRREPPYLRVWAQVYETAGDADASSRCHAAVPPAP